MLKDSSKDQLSGAIPPELGNLSNLEFHLDVGRNQLHGGLPLDLTRIPVLITFYFYDNADICVPTDAAFQSWLRRIAYRTINVGACMPAGTGATSP